MGPTREEEREIDDYAPISALQHFVVCERQAALIQIERVWVEDAATATGRVLHERADAPGLERRDGVHSVRAMRLASHALHLHGQADVVEFYADTKAIIPVEYKRGGSRFPRADAVQVCAQALCLEEMFGVTVVEGALFLAKTKKRKAIPITESLRSQTLQTVQRLHELLRSRLVPAPVLKPVCAKCSLEPMCQPHALRERSRGSRYLASLLELELDQ